MHRVREHYLVGRALYEAIARLEQLPEEQRPESDIDDMRNLLDEQYSGVLAKLVAREAYRPQPPSPVRLVPKATPPDDAE